MLWKNIGRCWRPLIQLVTGKLEWEPACRLRAVTLSDTRLSNLSLDAEEVLSGFLKITQRAMVKRRSLSVPVSTHLSHTTETSTLSRIKRRDIFFIKKCVCSFIELRKSWVYNIQIIKIVQEIEIWSYQKVLYSQPKTRPGECAT